MMKLIGSIAVIALMAGCCGDPVVIKVCPTYPKPSKYVLYKVSGLHDSKVDQWMVKQYKLNKKLKVCNETVN